MKQIGPNTFKKTTKESIKSFKIEKSSEEFKIQKQNHKPSQKVKTEKSTKS